MEWLPSRGLLKLCPIVPVSWVLDASALYTSIKDFATSSSADFLTPHAVPAIPFRTLLWLGNKSTALRAPVLRHTEAHALAPRPPPFFVNTSYNLPLRDLVRGERSAVQKTLRCLTRRRISHEPVRPVPAPATAEDSLQLGGGGG